MNKYQWFVQNNNGFCRTPELITLLRGEAVINSAATTSTV